MKVFEKEFPDLPGRDENINASNGEVCGVGARVTVTREQINDLNAGFGIDVEAMVTDALCNEAVQSLAKAVSDNLFNQRKIRIKKDKFKKELLKLTKKGEGFVLTNIQIGSIMQMEWEEFKIKPLDNVNTMGMMYELGKINNFKVYVDPNLTYKDNRVAISTKKFWNYQEKGEIGIMTEGKKEPNIFAKTYYKKKDPKSKVYEITNLENNE